jgi:hypothetical protein
VPRYDSVLIARLTWISAAVTGILLVLHGPQTAQTQSQATSGTITGTTTAAPAVDNANMILQSADSVDTVVNDAVDAVNYGAGAGIVDIVNIALGLLPDSISTFTSTLISTSISFLASSLGGPLNELLVSICGFAFGFALIAPYSKTSIAIN